MVLSITRCNGSCMIDFVDLIQKHKTASAYPTSHTLQIKAGLNLSSHTTVLFQENETMTKGETKPLPITLAHFGYVVWA